ncbi:MAG TPA: response regulator [Candidatus Paceibacterota bacterium]|nr:response regulator [Candidatus Paceibacterota bacterium]
MKETHSDKKKTSILIVEDDQSLLAALVDKFTREGFAVRRAANGVTGLAEAVTSHPDIILLDILLPEMDGLELLQKLRKQDDWGKEVPVIFLTNVSPNTDRIIARIAEDEPAYYLVKSDFLLSDVVGKVNERLAQNAAES